MFLKKRDFIQKSDRLLNVFEVENKYALGDI